MFEGSMKSFGWGYVGSNEKGFEWLFTPDVGDPSYLENPGHRKAVFVLLLSERRCLQERSSGRPGWQEMDERSRALGYHLRCEAYAQTL